MIPRVSLVTICHCTKLLLHYWLYSPLYISYLMTHLFCNWKLVPLINLPHLSHSSHIPLPSGNYLFVLCIYESASVFICLFTCYAFYSTYKWNHTVFVFQCLTPLSKIPSKSIHVVKMARFHSVLWLIVLSCSAVPDSCDPMDCSPPSSSIHGIFHAKILEWGKKKRILEWVGISYSRGSSQPRDQTCISCVSSISRRVLYHSSTREAQGQGSVANTPLCVHIYNICGTSSLSTYLSMGN